VFRAFFCGKKWLLWAYGGGLLTLGSFCIQVYLALRINLWQKDFFDMVQNGTKYTRAEFNAGIMQFAWIVAATILIGAATNYFRRLYVLRWREAMTFYYLPLWGNVKDDVENANQRIQDDTFIFADVVTGLGIAVFEAVASLIVFIPLLWGLNRDIHVDWIKNIPGSLVWLALAVSIIGTIISRFVGIKLWRLEYNKQRVEADYRAELVLGEKISKEQHAQIDALGRLFGAVRRGYQLLYLQLGFFEIWNNSFTQCMVVVPFMIAGENILAGIITWGTLQQTINALDHVRMRFSFFVDHWPTLMNLKSVRTRLGEFEQNLAKCNPKEFPGGEH